MSPRDSALLKRLALSLSLGYCDMCDADRDRTKPEHRGLPCRSFMCKANYRGSSPHGVVPAQFCNGDGLPQSGKAQAFRKLAAILAMSDNWAGKEPRLSLFRIGGAFLADHGDAHALIGRRRAVARSGMIADP